MENQHQKIEGYRDFKQETVDLINDIKRTGNTEIVALVERVKAFHEEELKRFVAEANTLPTADQSRMIQEGARCRAQAEEHFRLAFMMLIRSVARPTTEY